MASVDRRTFLATAGAAVAVGTASASRRPARHPGDDHRGPCSIASGNGLESVSIAMQRMRDGDDPAESVVGGVEIVELDPNDMSVGYGGLPNELGVVQLDASVMHGPSHKAGAVAALEGIKTPAAVALKVLRRTDHVLLVGEGALAFAKAHGFKEGNLLTERAREAWLRWKENLNPNDDWLDEEQHVSNMHQDVFFDSAGIPHTYGTIHCSGVNADGDLAGVTTTSGLSYKIPGRVGDSPIVGAGMYVDNDVGAAGATGRGEAVIQSCGAFDVVREMERGTPPTEACLQVLKRIARRTRHPRLLDDAGRPNFNVVMYALRKDGAYGSACMRGNREFAVHDSAGPRRIACARAF